MRDCYFIKPAVLVSGYVCQLKLYTQLSSPLKLFYRIVSYRIVFFSNLGYDMICRSTTQLVWTCAKHERLLNLWRQIIALWSWQSVSATCEGGCASSDSAFPTLSRWHVCVTIRRPWGSV